MSNYALIQNGVVVELFTPPTGATLDQCFTPQMVAQFVDVTAASPAPQVGWTATETGGAWSFAAPSAPPPPTLAQQAELALGEGVTITSTANPALNGVYAVNGAAQANLTATMLYATVNGKFPGSSSTQSWAQMNGDVVTFQTVAEFTAFATVLANYVADLMEIAMTNTGTLPAPTATIP
jgi:hypothetical protein